MAFSRYEPDQLPFAISGTVRWRWPGERLRLTVPCVAEWPVVDDAWPAATSDDDPPAAGEGTLEPGALGVTDRRIVFRSLERAGTPARISGLVIGVVTAFGYLIRETTLAPFGVAATALLLGAAWVIDKIGLGAGAIELDRIVGTEGDLHRIHGVDAWGVHYRLHLSETDFLRVTALLER